MTPIAAAATTINSSPSLVVIVCRRCISFDSIRFLFVVVVVVVVVVVSPFSGRTRGVHGREVLLDTP